MKLNRHFTLPYHLLAGFLCVFFVLLAPYMAHAQQTSKRVLFQGFWWDYWNGNYPGSWSNYLADLAPRLRTMGVDAVWIPPISKNANAGCTGTGCVGYSPFDHYDLGDKYQKSTPGSPNRTRMGTKDELLRMIAVMHANGIEVIQDIVLNHVDGATVPDPNTEFSTRTAAGYKNFRYACFATPSAEGGGDCGYFELEGRWPKNYPNFHPHAGHNVTEGDWESSFWGPDVCYGYTSGGEGNGYGSSSNCDNCGDCHDPAQSSGYMRNQARDWMRWLVKQTGVNGFRFDAVKHFPPWVTEDVLYNCQHNNGWANLGDEALSVGEWVGGAGQLDAWANNVQNRAGTFDFNLRAFGSSGGLRGMVTGQGGYNMADLPGEQQSNRVHLYGNTYVHRTVPFVNNHDTFRPQVDGSGNIVGWNTSQELSEHIDPKEPRLGAAYAIIAAMDGNPQFFFEDVFNLHNSSNRYGHDPTLSGDILVNSDIENIMQCHQVLDFGPGAYLVRHQSGDHLVIERSGRAVIGATDSWDVDQAHWIDTNFPPGTVLKDYSGGFTHTITVPQDGRINLETRAVGYPSFAYSTTYANPGSHYHGYSIWAPVGQSLGQAGNGAIPTTQEWEMADDLGDSHCESLTQGGALPAASRAYRIVGKIYPDQFSSVTYELYPERNDQAVVLEFYDLDGQLLHQAQGTGLLTGSFSVDAAQWVTAKIRHASELAAMSQKAFVKLTYEAPTSLDAANTPADNRVSFWTGAGEDGVWGNCRNWEEGMVPTAGVDVVIPEGASLTVPASVNLANVSILGEATVNIACGVSFNLTGDWDNQHSATVTGGGTVRMVGSGQQMIRGDNAFCKLEIDNGAETILDGDLTITDELRLTSGRLRTVGHDLYLQHSSAAALQGGDANNYIIGSLRRDISTGTAYSFPLGDDDAGYNPATVTFSALGTATQLTGSFNSSTPAASVPAYRGCDTNGDSEGETITYDCVRGGWQFEPDQQDGVAYTLTLQPAAAWVADCPYYHTLAKDGSFGCNQGLTKSFTSFSTFDLVGSSSDATSALPVSWLYFRGERTAEGAQLRWATAEEVNNHGFYVEKGTDGRTFTDIGFVPAQVEATSSARHYAFVDPRLTTSSYYRLRQVDTDGSFRYSGVVRLAVDKDKVRLAPNPFSSRVQLIWDEALPTEEAWTLRFHDLAGRAVFEEIGSPSELNALLGSNLRTLPRGVYLYQLHAGGEPYTGRVIKID